MGFAGYTKEDSLINAIRVVFARGAYSRHRGLRLRAEDRRSRPSTWPRNCCGRSTPVLPDGRFFGLAERAGVRGSRVTPRTNAISKPSSWSWLEV